VSALDRLDDDGVFVVSLVLGDGLVLGAVPVPVLGVAPTAPGDVVLPGAVLVLGAAVLPGDVDMLPLLVPGLVLELLGVLVVPPALGAVDVEGCVAVVDDDVELELSVVDCA
jgi:hypothetical protein